MLGETKFGGSREKVMRFKSIVLAAAAIVITAPAFAGGHCDTCFRREVTPAQYGVVHQTVQVAPARIVVQHHPAQIGVVHQTVQVRPAHVVTHRVPAQYGVVHETVQVAPATRGWVTRRDPFGREIICNVTHPARYATIARTVVTRPEKVMHQVVPAQYATLARTAVVRPETVRHHVIPPQYATVARTVQVAPASERWVQVAAPHVHRHHHHHQNQPQPRQAVVRSRY